VNYAVDEASLKVMASSGHASKDEMEQSINQIRKSNIILK
jgi:hypothetical protein